MTLNSVLPCLLLSHILILSYGQEWNQPGAGKDSLTIYSTHRISYQAVMKNGFALKDYMNVAEYTLFNSRGQEIEKTSYQKTGTNVYVNYRTKYLYDDHGNLISEKTYNGEGELTGTEYPSAGIGKNSGKENNFSAMGTCKFDGQGRIIERLSSPYRFTYEYNRQGDCIKEMIFINDRPDNITETEILYYYRPQRSTTVAEGLKGNVRSVRETSYKAVEKFGEIQKGEREREDGMFDSYMIYNKTGNYTELNLYFPDGRLSGRTVVRYDESGNQLQKEHFDEGGTLEETHTCRADDRGNIVVEETIRSDQDGNPEKTTITNNYDPGGNKIENHYIKSNGRDWKTTYEYDNQGNQIEQTSFDENGNVNMRWISKFDQNRRKTEMKRYQQGKLDFSYFWKYDDQGKMSEESGYNADGSLSFRNSYQYPHYEYDREGNWIQCIDFENGQPAYILEREITYY